MPDQTYSITYDKALYEAGCGEETNDRSCMGGITPQVTLSAIKLRTSSLIFDFTSIIVLIAPSSLLIPFHANATDRYRSL